MFQAQDYQEDLSVVKWISVDDSLPPDTNKVLITYYNDKWKGRSYTVGIYIGNEFEGKWIDEIYKRKTIEEEVTHWMHFPRLDQENESKNFPIVNRDNLTELFGLDK